MKCAAWLCSCARLSFFDSGPGVSQCSWGHGKSFVALFGPGLCDPGQSVARRGEGAFSVDVYSTRAFLNRQWPGLRPVQMPRPPEWSEVNPVVFLLTSIG